MPISRICPGCNYRHNETTCPECSAYRQCSQCGCDRATDDYQFCEGGCGVMSCCADLCLDCLTCEGCGCSCGGSRARRDGDPAYGEPRRGFTGDPTPRYPRFLGVEMECGIFTWREVNDACAHHGAGIHDDGSVSVDGSSAEIVSSPARGSAFEAQITDLCAAIKAGGGRVNRSCGLHVHIDVRDASTAQIVALARLYHRVEPRLYGIVSRSRRTNTFCGPWGDSLVAGDVGNAGAEPARRAAALAVNTYGSQSEAEWAKSNRSKHSTRYHGLNFNAIDVHGTIEFRLHHGTINARKVLMWAAVCSAIVQYALTHTEAEIDALRGTPAEVLDKVLASDPEVARWVKRRARWFEDQDRARRGLPPRRRAAAPAPALPPEEVEEEEEEEAGETQADRARVGRRMSYR